MSRSATWKTFAKLIVAACGVILLGGSARAGEETSAGTASEEAQRHAAEMNKGKSHEDARAGARAHDEDESATEQAKRHAAEMSKGKSHEDARSAASVNKEGEKAAKRAKKHAKELNKGKTHEEAKEAAEGK